MPARKKVGSTHVLFGAVAEVSLLCFSVLTQPLVVGCLNSASCRSPFLTASSGYKVFDTQCHLHSSIGTRERLHCATPYLVCCLLCVLCLAAKPRGKLCAGGAPSCPAGAGVWGNRRSWKWKPLLILTISHFKDGLETFYLSSNDDVIIRELRMMDIMDIKMDRIRCTCLAIMMSEGQSCAAMQSITKARPVCRVKLVLPWIVEAF